MSLVAVSGCGRTAESVAARDHSADASSSDPPRTYAAADRYSDRSSRSERRSGEYGGYHRREAVPSFHGRPMWSDNSRHSARENAEYHFERSGQDLGARNLDDFLVKVHAFVDHPPSGSLHMTRANGDRLIYDPKTNVFAVVRRDGAPRTIFKPNEKMAYWKEQQSRGDDYGGSRSRYQRGGYGGYEGRRSRSYERDDS